MATVIVEGGGGHTYVGANDTVYYQHGSVVTTAPPPYSGPSHGVYPGAYGPPPGAIPVTPATVIISNSLGSKPRHLMCQYCQAQIISRVDIQPTCRTHLCAFTLCFIGFWPCACILYCTDDCMGADHYCPNCNSHLGSYNK